MTSQGLNATVLQMQVGDFANIKPLNKELEDAMGYIAFMEISGAGGAVLSVQSVKRYLAQKDATMVTAIYLYCNWRVWRVYKTNEPLAQDYQKVCDEIDGAIFDDWKGTEQLAYFIRETD